MNRDREKLPFEHLLALDRVTRVVKGGRRFRFRATMIVGDKEGKVGIGIAKAGDVVTAIIKATERAERSMQGVVVAGNTISHQVLGVKDGSRVLLKPASPGTGLIAGGTVRVILEAAGVKDILAKSLGSNNKINNAYATINALNSQRVITKKNAVRKKQIDQYLKEQAVPDANPEGFTKQGEDK
ncbi:30S ribosomal protein S5 [Candidatus Saccharibacteria bacterium]|nr:30S ribosomal protein S5 [Candidatus Saccharibacteria bacterium]